jgi:adenine-specific DNA-methyltransferase
VPSEFLATGYGVQVKKFLATNRRLRHLILFDTEDRVFPEAATTACVLLFEGEPTDALEVWHLSGVGDAPVYAELCGERSLRQADARIPYDQLDVESNWQGLGCVDFDLKGFVALSEFGDVKRGIATGANEFFVLKPSEALKNGLTSTDLQPCIANASSVPDIMFAEGDWESLRRQDRPCYLFNGMGGQGTAAMRYVAYGEEQGYHRRYLTKMRKPWYKLELRQPAPLLLAVFGRGGFRVSLNRSSAVNLTAFHGFYPKESARFLLPLIWLYFQTATARDAFAIQQRAYGDGLKKLEPGDWSKLLVPDWRYWDENDLCIAIQWAQEALAEFDEGRGDRVDRWAMRLNELIRQRRWRSTETRHADPQIVLS